MASEGRRWPRIAAGFPPWRGRGYGCMQRQAAGGIWYGVWLDWMVWYGCIAANGWIDGVEVGKNERVGLL